MLNEGEVVSLATMIDAYTINAAWLMHHDERTGSIEVGKRADMVVLDRDLFEIPVTEINEARVLWTFLDGDIVFSKNNTTIIDNIKEYRVKQQEIMNLAEAQPERNALPQAFYRDPDIYRQDIERIFLKSWLYAGHQSEIPNVGDWFLFEFDQESVIIVRSAESGFNALVNVCRHRGSRVCVESKGCSKLLRCRYHGWSYDLQGQLRAAAHMGDSFDKSQISLKKIHVAVLEGMIFVNFAEHPADFSMIRDGLADCLEPYGLANAKVAHRESYPIASNWKLALENYVRVLPLRTCAPGVFDGARTGARGLENRTPVPTGHVAGGRLWTGRPGGQPDVPGRTGFRRRLRL